MDDNPYIVLVMAAKEDADDTLRSHTDMVEDFVVKPFSARELAGQAKNILGRIYFDEDAAAVPDRRSHSKPVVGDDD